MQRKSLLLLTLFASSPFLLAQDGFIGHWERRASATQTMQPAWPPPLITTYVGLIQVARADFIRQTAPNHTETWNLDGGKGLNMIPLANTELDVNLPPYLVHSVSTVINGAGDMSFVLKYRYLSGSAKHGNYDLSAFLSSTIPTGSYKNGALDATVSPNVGVGKGFGMLRRAEYAGREPSSCGHREAGADHPLEHGDSGAYRKVFLAGG